jgi:hypothetical protein
MDSYGILTTQAAQRGNWQELLQRLDDEWKETRDNIFKLFVNAFSSGDPETVRVVLERYSSFLQSDEEWDAVLPYALPHKKVLKVIREFGTFSWRSLPETRRYGEEYGFEHKLALLGLSHAK